MPRWVNFKELREQLDFAAVLQHYQVTLKVRGERHQGFCPLPTHQGKRRSPSFSAHLTKGIWQCFGCGAKGNILDFAMRMEGFDPQDRAGLRQTALVLQEHFGGERPVSRPAAFAVGTPLAAQTKVVVNAPLSFELQNLAADHPYLRHRGFTPDTPCHFGLGYCNRGWLKGRITIPLHDAAGHLIGYAGRVVNDQLIDQDHPKYRFPGRRERARTLYEFRKSLFLYHGHRIAPSVSDLTVVEGFPGVWWLWQAGCENVVGLMGASCSAEQAALIVGLVAPGGRVWIFPDGDQAGERCATSVLGQVARHRFVRWIVAEPGRQPTDYSADELKNMLPKEVMRDGWKTEV